MDLVVVSNRVARAKANEPMTGGLAAGLLPIVEKSGAIWVGSSGKVSSTFNKDSFIEVEPLGKGALALMDLPAAHYGGYYEGFANSALWPAVHSRLEPLRKSGWLTYFDGKKIVRGPLTVVGTGNTPFDDVAAPFAICSNTSASCSPRKIEMIAGGASLAPSRWSLVADATDTRSSPANLCTARITAAQNTRN